MAQWVKVATVSELAPGQCTTVHAGGKSIALYNVNDTVYATDDTCLHKGGPLGEGSLEGTTITCPWHFWQYDVTTGKNILNPSVGVDTYDVKVEGDDILVEL